MSCSISRWKAPPTPRWQRWPTASRQASGSDNGRRRHVRRQGIEIIAGQLQLLPGALGAVDRFSEAGIFRVTFCIPAQMLAGNAQAAVFAVKRVQGLEVLNKNVAHVRHWGLRKAFAGGQIMGDLAENPRPPLGGRS